MTKKSILVVGAGPSGLVAVKEMVAAGFDVTAIDKAPDIGGVFRHAPGEWSYKDLYLTISNFFMAYSDFPPLEDELKYSSKEEYFDYLKAYAKHFDLMKHIQLETGVESATLSEDGTWKVITKTACEKIVEYNPDCLIVATGSNHQPKTIPTDGFTGEVVHSSDYRGPEPYKEKRVLVVGSGESGSDITHQIINKGAKSVTVWTRRYPLLAPRFMSVAFDEQTPYDENQLIHNQQKNAKGNKVSDLLEVHTTSRVAGWLPPFAYALFRHHFFWNHPRYYKDGSQCRVKLLADWSEESCKGAYWKADQVGPATKNCYLSVLDSRGLVDTVVAPRVRFEDKKVIFSEATWWVKKLDQPAEKTVEVDAVILCTGYKTQLDWLHLPSSCDFEPNPRTWYKHCFPPKLGDKLMFLGWTRPHQGGIPACSELLSRYIGLLLNGHRHLPKNYAQIAKEEGEVETKYYEKAPFYHTLVDYPSFTESVSDLIGCRPRCPLIFNFERFAQYWLYPSWPCWFRKDGPGSDNQALATTLGKVPLKTSWAPDPIFILSAPIVCATVCVNKLLGSIPLLGGLFRKSGETFGWRWMKPRSHILHGNQIPSPWILQAAVLGGLVYLNGDLLRLGQKAFGELRI